MSILVIILINTLQVRNTSISNAVVGNVTMVLRNANTSEVGGGHGGVRAAAAVASSGGCGSPARIVKG